MLECLICGTKIKHQNSSVLHIWNGIGFKFHECSECGGGLWYPRLIPKKDFYEQGSESISKPALVRHTIGSRQLGANHLTFFRRHSIGIGSLLDIGCGDGIFMEEACRKGFQVYGVDLDSKALAISRKRGLNNLYCQSLEEFVEKMTARRIQFDVVTLFEVLEHQPEPFAFMEIVKTLLQPGGIIAGSIPNRKRYRLWVPEEWDCPPYHFTRWDVKSLRHFLERLGLQDIVVKDVGHGYYLMFHLNRVTTIAKRALLPSMDEINLKIYTLEELTAKVDIGKFKLSFLRALKKGKAAIFTPVVGLETLLSWALDKGHFLYFEGRLEK